MTHTAYPLSIARKPQRTNGALTPLALSSTASARPPAPRPAARIWTLAPRPRPTPKTSSASPQALSVDDSARSSATWMPTSFE
jgi:hypothetical protein